MEERFHVRVVIHLTRPIHALDEALATHDRAVSVSGVFDAPVAVEHQTGAGIALAQGMARRLQNRIRHEAAYPLQACKIRLVNRNVRF